MAKAWNPEMVPHRKRYEGVGTGGSDKTYSGDELTSKEECEMMHPYGWKNNSATPPVPGFLRLMRSAPVPVYPIAPSLYPGQYALPFPARVDPYAADETKLEKEISELAEELLEDHETLSVDAPAPDFTLPAVTETRMETVSLADYRGRWLALLFYVGDFTFVCPTELQAVAEKHSEFREAGAEVLAISTDSVWSHRVFRDTVLKTVPFPLLSDRSHTVSASYGVLNKETGASRRATLIIDPEGIVQHVSIYPADVGRNVEEMLRILHALQHSRQTGQMTPAGWRKGSPGIGIPQQGGA
jgi:alkyl hydroperoxide reductase subunit AhpC